MSHASFNPNKIISKILILCKFGKHSDHEEGWLSLAVSYFVEKLERKDPFKNIQEYPPQDIVFISVTITKTWSNIQRGDTFFIFEKRLVIKFKSFSVWENNLWTPRGKSFGNIVKNSLGEMALLVYCLIMRWMPEQYQKTAWKRPRISVCAVRRFTFHFSFNNGQIRTTDWLEAISLVFELHTSKPSKDFNYEASWILLQQLHAASCASKP